MIRAKKALRNKLAILRAVKGIWAGRLDLPDFSTLRKEWERNMKRQRSHDR